MLRVLLMLACLMIVAGAAAMINGSSMILNERGWSQLIAGSVVLTGGLVVSALAGLLYHLQNLWQTQGRSITAPSDSGTQPILPKENPALAQTPVADITGHETHQVRGDAPPVSHPAGQTPLNQNSSSPNFSSQDHQHHSLLNQELAHISAVQKDTLHPSRLHDDPSPVFVSLPDADYDQFKPLSQPAETLASVPFSPEPNLATRDAPAARPQLKQPSLFEVVQDQHQGFGVTPSAKPAPFVHQDRLPPSVVAREDRVLKSEPVVPAPPPELKERLLLASYSTGGVGYFMYSDQSIEAEMAIGRYRFNSMNELRTFIETQVGGERVSD